EDSHHRLWVATDSGTSLRSADRFITVPSRLDQSRCIHWAITEFDDSIFIATGCGLLQLPNTVIAQWQSGRSASDIAAAMSRYTAGDGLTHDSIKSLAI